MPLSLVVPPASSPADAIRQALIGSFYDAHRPELADLVASADLALDFPGPLGAASELLRRCGLARAKTA